LKVGGFLIFFFCQNLKINNTIKILILDTLTKIIFKFWNHVFLKNLIQMMFFQKKCSFGIEEINIGNKKLFYVTKS